MRRIDIIKKRRGVPGDAVPMAIVPRYGKTYRGLRLEAKARGIILRSPTKQQLLDALGLRAEGE